MAIKPPNTNVVLWFIVGLVVFTYAARNIPFVRQWVGLN